MSINEPVVMKFGGTSVATANGIQTIAEITGQSTNPVVIVVSALSGITDKLLAFLKLPKHKFNSHQEEIRRIHLSLIESLLAPANRTKAAGYLNQRIGELETLLESSNNTPEFSDKIVSLGETLSSFIVSEALNERNIKSRQIISTDCIITNDIFGSADFIPGPTGKKVRKIIGPLLNNGIVPVITGFLGSTPDNRTTTLGRGGSDYTASILGHCLNALEVQIWTDVDGIFTADPRVVEDAKLIDRISYKEASELATFGAKVLHPRTIRPAILRNIPVRVLNTFNPKSKGTLITNEPTRKKGVKAVTSKLKTTLINIHSTDMLFSKGYLARIFDIFAREEISVDLVSVSEVSVSVTLDENPKVARAIAELEKFAGVTQSSGVGTISLIGEDVIESSHVLTEVSGLFHRNKISIRMISFGASNVNISFVVDEKDVKKAVRLVHAQILSGQPLRIRPVKIDGLFAGGIKI